MRQSSSYFLMSTPGPIAAIADGNSCSFLEPISRHNQTLNVRPSLNYYLEPHRFTAVIPLVSSAKPAEAYPPSPRLRSILARIPPRLDSHGFLHRRVKNSRHILAPMARISL